MLLWKRKSFLLLNLLLIFALMVSAAEASQNARYRVTFEADWSSVTHPSGFPGGAHFSGLIGATHGTETAIWRSGELASNGIESMAETGSAFLLRTEIEAQITLANALSVISAGGISNSNTSVSTEFEVNDAYPLVSIFSMVAPSPDWFIGVDSIDLSDDNGGFVASKTVDLLVYDAGTDAGVSFTSENSNSGSVVTLLNCANTTTECGFAAGKGTDGVDFIGRFVFERVQ